MERQDVVALPLAAYNEERKAEQVVSSGDAVRYHPVERCVCFILSLILLGFYSFVIWIGLDDDNPYELGLRAVCYGPSCLLMGIGYMVMTFIGKRVISLLLYILPVVIIGLNIFLIIRIWSSGIEGLLLGVERSIGMFFLR